MATKAERDESIEMVLNGLQTLILAASRRAAGEQYAPGSDPDASDDTIRMRKREMDVLRRMRQEFEDLTTGFLADAPGFWVMEVVAIDRSKLVKCGELIRQAEPGVEFTLRGVR